MSNDGIQQQLTGAVRDRYLVEREIARGGMATVYLAREIDRDRLVAIKVMHPRLAAVLGAKRFLREIGLVRQMNHPLIVPLCDSGEADGLLYYVMPYIGGETLFTRLRRDGRLQPDEALRIASDVGQALGYAHSHGFLHRDVKPENILLAEGRALVADFGLARAIGAEYTRLTRTGAIVGTVGYMSPEQLREDHDLDQRVDVYSLGCILYEMVTGEPPYIGATLKELVSRVLRMPVPSVRTLAPVVPGGMDAAIAKAMAKSVEARFATTDQFVEALRGLSVQ